jgi:hypothetical protein
MPTNATFTVDKSAPERLMVVIYGGKTIESFKTTGGLVQKVSF